ncbi:MAG: MFS transporter [Sphingomonadales bacterium]|nr:MFS transporter [Sphingomonadales bacterium]
MSYLGEFRSGWRPLLAAAVGSASGLMVAAYTTSLFSPYLISEFHWSRAQFSLIGLTIFAALLVMPVVGRLTDRFGVRPMALAGALLLPLCFLGYSLQNGQFWFFAMCSTGVLVLGSTTTPTVWCRPVAEHFHKARGLALFVVTGAPALAGALLPRLLVMVNDHWGWRVGYRVLAVWFLVGGLLAVATMPKAEPGLDRRPGGGHQVKRGQPGAFREIVRSRSFWIITGAMVLCIFPTQLHAAQMMLMLNEAGLDRYAGADAFSAFAVGSIIGRGACGLALDRFPAKWVAALSMILPALGYVLIATNHGAVGLVTGAMFLVGISYGAESDLPSFLVARHFRLEVFSSAMSLVYCGVLFASATGAMMLALVLRRTNSFTPFLLACAVGIVLGSLLFLALPRRGVDEEELGERADG